MTAAGRRVHSTLWAAVEEVRTRLAEATGAVAMPLKEPAPPLGMSLQPGPKVSAPASLAGAAELVEASGLELLALLLESSLPQAERPAVRTRAREATAPPRRRIVEVVMALVPFGGGVSGWFFPERVVDKWFGAAAPTDWCRAGFFGRFLSRL